MKEAALRNATAAQIAELAPAEAVNAASAESDAYGAATDAFKTDVASLREPEAFDATHAESVEAFEATRRALAAAAARAGAYAPAVRTMAAWELPPLAGAAALAIIAGAGDAPEAAPSTAGALPAWLQGMGLVTSGGDGEDPEVTVSEAPAAVETAVKAWPVVAAGALAALGTDAHYASLASWADALGTPVDAPAGAAAEEDEGEDTPAPGVPAYPDAAACSALATAAGASLDGALGGATPALAALQQWCSAALASVAAGPGARAARAALKAQQAADAAFVPEPEPEEEEGE